MLHCSSGISSGRQAEVGGHAEGMERRANADEKANMFCYSFKWLVWFVLSERQKYGKVATKKHDAE